MLLSLIYSSCAGGGHLSEVDALRADPAACRLAGLRAVPDSWRLGAYLAMELARGVRREDALWRDRGDGLVIPDNLAHFLNVLVVGAESPVLFAEA